MQVAVERETFRMLSQREATTWNVSVVPFPHPSAKSPSAIANFAPTFLFASLMFQFVLQVNYLRLHQLITNSFHLAEVFSTSNPDFHTPFLFSVAWSGFWEGERVTKDYARAWASQVCALAFVDSFPVLLGNCRGLSTCWLFLRLPLQLGKSPQQTRLIYLLHIKIHCVNFYEASLIHYIYPLCSLPEMTSVSIFCYLLRRLSLWLPLVLWSQHFLEK